MSAEILPLTPTTIHRAKMAYVYIRQSSLMQVTRHAESTDLQYSLVERAVALGWPRERVGLIDEDLGKSGAQAEARGGFQRLLAEISLARVGLVLSFDASRLARNNRDWYQLLEVCSIFGTLIADDERLYDPRLYHDRLLLGLSGMMSEAITLVSLLAWAKLKKRKRPFFDWGFGSHLSRHGQPILSKELLTERRVPGTI